MSIRANASLPGPGRPPSQAAPRGLRAWSSRRVATHSMSDHERTTSPHTGTPNGGDGNGGYRGRAAAARQAQGPKPPRRHGASASCALLAAPVRPRPARGRLDGLRDDDGRRRPTCRSSRLTTARNSRSSSTSRATPLGLLTGDQKRARSLQTEIAPVMKHAIIAIEDRRFYTNEGVDLRGIGRALVPGRRRSSAVVQGGSTITQQFVKNALAAQDERTLFQKLREAALAYHLTRKWSKEKILTQVPEHDLLRQRRLRRSSRRRARTSAVDHPGCDEQRRRASAPSELEPHEAALLAGMVASPSAYDPIAHPRGRAQRRNLVLAAMLEQRFLTRAQYDDARAARRCPTHGDLQPPAEDTAHPYFTTWVKQQVVDRLGGGQEGARRAFEGGLHDPDDARPRPPGRRRGRDRQQWLPEPRRPARSARRDRERDRQGARDGRRRRLQRRGRSTSRPRASASPARRSSRSSSRRRCGRASRPNSVWASQQARRSTCRSSQGDVHGQQLRGRLLRQHHARARDDVLRQLSVRPGRHQGRHAQGRPAGRADGHPHARLAQLRDDARRPARRASPRSTWRTRTRRSPAAAS